jgi:hypothetical protein
MYLPAADQNMRRLTKSVTRSGAAPLCNVAKTG